MSPHELTTQILALTSSWIDLCSPDPLIANVSRQVLMLEVSYAAFCGATFIVVPGPKLNAGMGGLNKYGRAIQEALEVGPYLQIVLWFPMSAGTQDVQDQMGDLGQFEREEYLQENDLQCVSVVD
ncbi:MAG: hypothetical protein Q9227_005251 [Pyrenula ochraceoflavens]